MLLRSAEVGRLAVSVADHPDIFPINYLVDHGTIVFWTGEARNSPRRSPAPLPPLRETVTNRTRETRGAS
jgi:hypothetical protein